MSTEKLHSSRYMSLFNDRILLPSGQEIEYARFELRDFASVLPIKSDKIVMIRIYRYPANRLSLEVPSGYLEVGEDPKRCALRELEEETGYKAGKIQSMGWFHPWTRSTRKAHLFIAKDLTKGAQKPEDTEQIEVQLLSLEEAENQLYNNKITHAPTIIILQKFISMQK